MMARFTSAPDIWALDDSERAKLQPGQWVRCGDSHYLSRFYSFTPATGHVVAFHGPRATRKLREYIASNRAAAVRAALRSGQVPPYARPRWRGDKLANEGCALPLWSGKTAPPAIGSTVTLGGLKPVRAVITGYKVDAPWLMALGYRVDEPSRRGDIAGAEILS